ncbi:MAG: zinc ribbon domain-containing protein [Bryobacteraceae bacterium]
MNLIIAVVGLLAVTLFFTLSIRAKDLPKPEPVSPTQHLEEKKAAIYENLRDLQFEFRVGKLSDVDYQATKLSLQKELAIVIGEINKLTGPAPASAAKAAAAPVATVRPADANAGFVCPHCGHEFPNPMKFCGECGKEMA